MRSPAVSPRALAMVAAMLALGCGGNGHPPGRPDGGPSDGDDRPSARTLSIAVTGCTERDLTTNICLGAPPLVLSFAPVGSPELTRFLWTFGDGSPAVTERAPTHTYVLPESYTVRLVGGGPFGEIAAGPDLRVQVQSLSAGLPCDVAAQCAEGLACICTPGSGCSSAFVRGLCSATCDRGSCGVGTSCVALPLDPTVAAGDGGASPPFCLADCARDSDCHAGLVCVGAPAGASTAPARWTAGCLPPGAYKRIGESCRGPDGTLDDSACATGACADVGALGVCSAGCEDDRPCPLGGACVRLGDGRRLCLATCSSSDECGIDPLLACAPVGGGGTDGAVTPAVCAPKVCASEADCAPSGRCGADAHCARR